jgi:hypothetical protein
MTDARDNNDEDRVDLRALGLERDEARENAVMTAVLARLPHRAADVPPLLVLRRHLLAAAAVLAVIAGLSALRARGNDDGESLLLTWATNGHVPTNGELLAAYQGYRP